jgi:hypothetical protein
MIQSTWRRTGLRIAQCSSDCFPLHPSKSQPRKSDLNSINISQSRFSNGPNQLSHHVRNHLVRQTLVSLKNGKRLFAQTPRLENFGRMRLVFTITTISTGCSGARRQEPFETRLAITTTTTNEFVAIGRRGHGYVDLEDKRGGLFG